MSSKTGAASKPPAETLIADSVFKPSVNKAKHAVAATGFHIVERILLILVALMTIGGAITEIVGIYQTRSIAIAAAVMARVRWPAAVSEPLGSRALCFASDRHRRPGRRPDRPGRGCSGPVGDSGRYLRVATALLLDV